MKRNDKLILILGLALLLLIGGAALLYGELGESYAPDSLVTLPAGETAQPSDSSTTAPDTEPEDILAPDFTVYDAEGNAVNLSDFAGKPVIINFWASWCPPCRAEMPDFDAAYAEHGEDITFMMVNMTDGMQETVESAQAHVAEMGYKFPVYFDTAYSAASTYSTASLPTTYFIRADGSIAAYAVGMIDAATLARGIDMLS